jgi:hypothetical protein
MQIQFANVSQRTTDWQRVNWRKAHTVVRNLRQRIFKATRNNDWKRVRSLQKLLLKSYSNVLLAVRRVTQINVGKRTAGIDKLLIKTGPAKAQLVDWLKLWQPWQPLATKRVYIPKVNGKRRPLGIPSVIDRCYQAMVKAALEPCWEAQFEPTSYGFRPSRSAQDAIGQIYVAANVHTRKKWVLDADITGCFDPRFRQKLRDTYKRLQGSNAMCLIRVLNPILRGWANYYRGVVSSKVFGRLEGYVFWKTRRWISKTHPNKSYTWRDQQYWMEHPAYPGKTWSFVDNGSGMVLYRIGCTRIQRHVLIQGKACLDDPDYRDYFEQRRRQSQQIENFPKAAQRIIRRQQAQCPHCGQSLFNQEEVHIHHKTPRAKGGSNLVSNLVALHMVCHLQLHREA